MTMKTISSLPATAYNLKHCAGSFSGQLSGPIGGVHGRRLGGTVAPSQ